MKPSFTKEEILEIQIPLDESKIKDMLSELLRLKDADLKLYNLISKYFTHPYCPSKTKKREYRKIIRKLLEKTHNSILIHND